MKPEDLHVFFLPFLAPGHMIPMIDIAKLFASRGVRCSIVTTTGNVPLIKPTIDRCPHTIQLLAVNLQQSSVENLTALPSPRPTPELLNAVDSLKEPFHELVSCHRPDVIVTDIFYTWSVDLGLPRLAFHGSSAFCTVVSAAISRLGPQETLALDEPFAVPGLPHHIVMTKSQLLDGLPTDQLIRMGESYSRSYGVIGNTFYALESDYLKMMMMMIHRSWHVGPVSLCNQQESDKAARGGCAGGAKNSERFLSWLDSKEPGSVVYICFGSLGRFTCAQMRELAEGLQGSGHKFMWVLRDFGDGFGWMPEGFEDEEKNMIVADWAPQILILNHPAVGGFVTHCGWNSCLEGASAGVPMITWPLFADQFLNEKLVVSVLRTGVSVGSTVCSYDAERRMLVRAEEVEKAVKEVMGSGEEAEERRKRAREMAGMAKKAVEEGGSSHDEMTRLIQQLMDLKAAGGK